MRFISLLVNLGLLSRVWTFRMPAVLVRNVNSRRHCILKSAETFDTDKAMDGFLENTREISQLVKQLEQKNMVSVAIASSMLTRQAFAYDRKERNDQLDLPLARVRLKDYQAYRDDQISDLTRSYALGRFLCTAMDVYYDIVHEQEQDLPGKASMDKTEIAMAAMTHFGCDRKYFHTRIPVKRSAVMKMDDADFLLRCKAVREQVFARMGFPVGLYYPVFTVLLDSYLQDDSYYQDKFPEVLMPNDLFKIAQKEFYNSVGNITNMPVREYCVGLAACGAKMVV